MLNFRHCKLILKKIDFCIIIIYNTYINKIDDILKIDGFCLVEVFVDVNQKFEPKSATKRYPDGTLVSPPLEDLYPFLPRE